MNMKRKWSKWLRLHSVPYVIVFILLFVNISCSNKELDDIRDKTYFAFKQTQAISDIVECHVPYEYKGNDFYNDKNMVYNFIMDIPSSGILSLSYIKFQKTKGPEYYSGYFWDNIVLKDNVFIDPFIPGQYEVTVNYWRHKATDDWTPKSVTMKGSPLYYITNKNDVFVVIYVGPDGDIDYINKNIPQNPRKPDNKVYHLFLFNDIWVIPLYEDKDAIIYDPTNGLFSNGDIIWTIYKSPKFHWYETNNYYTYDYKMKKK